MADFNAVHIALRLHALDVVVRSTGPVALASNPNGFTRDDGSFVDDGFERGMEVSLLNFGLANPMHAVITSVSPLDMRVKTFALTTVDGTSTASEPKIFSTPSTDNRVITSIVPSMWALENEAPDGMDTFTPINGVPYIEEEFSPSTSRKVGAPVRISQTEDVGQYFLKWYGVPGTGAAAMRKGMDALKDAFPSGTVLSAGIDSVLIDSDPAPTTDGIIQGTSRPVLILTIPWVVRSRPSSH